MKITLPDCWLCKRPVDKIMVSDEWPFLKRITVFCHGEKQSAVVDEYEVAKIACGDALLKWHPFRPVPQLECETKAKTTPAHPAL
jgi:hypothetical protein